MAIQIKFDANQQYQRDAIDSVIELFGGQEQAEQGISDAGFTSEGTLDLFQEVVFGNSLALSSETLEQNLRRIQDREVVTESGDPSPAIPESARADWDDETSPDFSVEMETGTGKTYVYLRTIAELNKKYGFTKFVIVVPTVAIREGVLSSLRLLSDHIRDTYDGLQFDSYVYDSAALTRVRQFATASHLQIMVINIDAFAKDTNVINRPTDAMNGYSPIEFLRACNPIVVMDEPQNMETDTRKKAIASLWPLFKLRYSATHRDLKHLVYKLTPVDAYDLRLVKRIGVLSIIKDDDLNEPFVEVTKITPSPTNVTATLRIHKATKQGTKPTLVTIRKDDDLEELSGGRDIYKGWAVEDIHGDTGIVEFGNGRWLRVGSSTGQADEQLQRLQLRQAIESHFETELQLKQKYKRGVIAATIKPLTLFFIDKVANYHPEDGRLRVWFQEDYEAVRSDARFRTLDMPDLADVHDGYFATNAKGAPKDLTSADTKDAATAFERIMQNKEKLLSFEEPLRFIFSHSALAEGWDNPNVFTICNLQDGKSEMRKRQQIGRGLRLPVMENGDRCRVDEVNMLTVIANETFTSFAEALQKEIEDETGVKFGGRITNVKKKTKLTVKKEVLDSPLFKKLWERISQRTTYELGFDAGAVVTEALERIAAMEDLEAVKFRVSKSTVKMKSDGISGGDSRDRGTVAVDGERRIPDIVGELCRRVPLSRRTIVQILKSCNKLDQVTINPSVFIDRVAEAMNQALYDQVADSIVYSPVDGKTWSAQWYEQFHQEETVAPIVINVKKSITDKVVCDSKVEEEFAKFLDKQDDVKLFLKLPGWFKISTPLGNYNPDWAFVRETASGQHVYLVRETKGTSVLEDLRFESEKWKIKFGRAHFEALRVDFAFGSNPKVLIEYEPVTS